VSSEARLYGWLRRLERDDAGTLRAFELQQTRNLNHCIPVALAEGIVLPSGLADGVPVRVEGTVLGGAPVAGDEYLPSVCFVADNVNILRVEAGEDAASVFFNMPSTEVFALEPSPDAIADDFMPPAEQFGDDEVRDSNRVVVCGFLVQALLTDGINAYERRDSMELLLRLALPPAHPVQVRLYGRHAQTYARFTSDNLPLKIAGFLRIRTKPSADPGSVRRMLYIHCDHLRVPALDELPYEPQWLSAETPVDAALQS